jgi:hypothetical protein
MQVHEREADDESGRMSDTATRLLAVGDSAGAAAAALIALSMEVRLVRESLASILESRR